MVLQEIKFSNQNMQKYFDTIKSKKTLDLDLMLAEKKMDLERHKFFSNLMMVCYVSFFILGMPQRVLPKWFEGEWAVMAYAVVVLVALSIGMTVYHKFLERVIAEYEVLNYLKKKDFNTNF